MDWSYLRKFVRRKLTNQGDPEAKLRVAVLDLGVKRSILSNFNERGVFCKVFPARTPHDELAAWKPDGYFIANGPGDPAAMPYAVETVKQALDTEKPLFGICLRAPDSVLG